MRKILGLDLGTNSIGWALVEVDDNNKIIKIIAIGSRVLPLDSREISNFEEGGTLKSATADRTDYRGARRLLERFLLRRERLHLVLNELNILPEHYKNVIIWGQEDTLDKKNWKKHGQFKELKKGEKEVKLPYKPVKDSEGFAQSEAFTKQKFEFIFKDAFNEMLADFKKHQPELFYKKENGEETKIPYDWTIYYLRKKALQGGKITKEELAWVILNYNQKRGYEKTLGKDDIENKDDEIIDKFTAKVSNVEKLKTSDKYKITLSEPNNPNNIYFEYFEETAIQITNKGDLKEFIRTAKIDEKGDEIEHSVEYKINELQKLKIISVKKEEKAYIIQLETGWEFTKKTESKPKWENKERDFVISTKYDKNGNEIKTKEGNTKRIIKSPEDDDWNLVKLKTANELEKHINGDKNRGVATYLYENLLKNPNNRLKRENGLITVIDRKYYKNELKEILNKQKHLIDESKLTKITELLYPNNKARKDILQKGTIADIITDDIIFYQRDLKSKKSLIANCRYEYRGYNKEGKPNYIKAIHKAHPFYQEFRLWKFIKNLKIHYIGNNNLEDITLTINEKEKLFDFLNNKKQINEKQILRHLKLKESEYRWNYTQREEEKENTATKESKPCNVTRYDFIVRLKRVKGFNWSEFLTKENGIRIWHFIYSVRNAEQYEKGLTKLFRKLNVDESFIPEIKKQFLSFPSFKNDYANYSEKAIKKILVFMRLGKFWQKQQENEKIKKEIETADLKVKQIISIWNKIKHDKDRINEIKDTNVSKGTLTSFYDFTENDKLQDLAEHQACYILYNRYSEVGDVQFWKTPDDIKHFLEKDFKQHSLRNPIVEKVLRETLQVVKEIWIQYGNSKEKFFSEIHIEMLREMQKTQKQRKKMTELNKKNQKTNNLIHNILQELKNANPNSEQHKTKLKIIEDGAWLSIKEDKGDEKYYFKDKNGKPTSKEITKKDLFKIRNSEKVSSNEILKYKLWLEQRYQSPYTGKFIKLSDLFDEYKYQKEHVFARKRINMDEFSNLVICESEVNKLKDTKTGLEFIKNPGRKSIKCLAHNNSEVNILSEAAYRDLVNNTYVRKKKEILLSEKIPSKFTNAQKQNSAFITKTAMQFMSNIVREEGEDSYRAKKVLAVNGKVTSILKKDWRLNNVWNRIILPRFERMNSLLKTTDYTKEIDANGHNVTIPIIPKDFKDKAKKKRIDHRHHALDALIVALTTVQHNNYLNNIFGDSKQGKDIETYRKQLTEKIRNSKSDKSRRFKLPYAWNDYKYEFKGEQKQFEDFVFSALQSVIISFKQNKKIISFATNYYQKWENGKKVFAEQKADAEKGIKKNFGIRKTLHTPKPYGRKIYNFDVLDIKDKNIDNFHLIIDDDIRKQVEEKYVKSKMNKKTIATLCKDYAKEHKKLLKKQENIEKENLKEEPNTETITKLENEIKILQEKLKGINVITDKFGFLIEKTAYKTSGTKKYRKRKPISILSDRTGQNSIKTAEAAIKLINKVADRELHLNLLNHLYENDRDINKAFSIEGIAKFNSKRHKPVYNLPIAEKSDGKKFQIGNKRESTKVKYGEADTNPYFAIYWNSEKQKKEYQTIPLYEVLERKNQGLSSIPETLIKKDIEYQLLTYFSTNDLVYILSENEYQQITEQLAGFGTAEYENIIKTVVDFNNFDDKQRQRIYAVNDFSGVTCKFRPNTLTTNIAKKEVDYRIKNKKLIGSDDIKTTIYDNFSIKERCIKLQVNRLGKIIGFKK